MAQPNQMLTITRLEPTRQGSVAVLQRLRACLKRRAITGVWAYHVEANPRGTGAHAHIWWRGDHITHGLLAEAAAASRAGSDSDVRAAFAPPGPHAPHLDYGIKALLSNRPDRPDEMWPAAADYLQLNGGRLVTASQGFWTDWDGRPITGGVVRARTIAHQWMEPLPASPFLDQWRRGPITSRPAQVVSRSCSVRGGTVVS